MVHSLVALDAVSDLRKKFNAGQTFSNDEIAELFRAFDDVQEELASAALIHLSSNDCAALTTMYDTVLGALKRAGLHLHQVTAPDNQERPWVWFYRWSGCTKQGPFGTLDAAVRAAVLQVRSGVIKQV